MRTRHAFRTYVSFLCPVCVLSRCPFVPFSVWQRVARAREIHAKVSSPRDYICDPSWRQILDSRASRSLVSTPKNSHMCVTGLRFLENRSSHRWNLRCLWYISATRATCSLCVTFENRVYLGQDYSNLESFLEWENFSSVLEENVNTIEEIELASGRGGRELFSE